MLVKQEMLSKIKDYFNLNMYETKVWLALLGKGVASAGEVAEISRVPRSRTYDVLESLEKKGFAIIKLGKPVKYLGVKPNMILEKLKNNVRSDAEERIVTLGNIKTTEEFSKLESLYKEGIDPVKREDLSSAVKGKSNISNYLKEILNNAEKEVIICTNAEDVSSKLKLFQQTIESLGKGKVKIKIALSGEEDLIKKISESLNIKIKKIDIDAKFFIVDRTEILFYISKDSKERSGEDIAVWLNSEFFSRAFAALFEKAIGGSK
ncbi:MAG TPA: TrmB family transcriptional regulator [Candidatus Pacearchaeota archaeon]|nr:TrmB family transcriptional regulator [Candidatus Pacearchaeota archaeon]